MRRAGLLLLAVGIGVLLWPPFDLAPLAFVAVAPLVAALDGVPPRRAFGLAWLQVLGGALLVFHWFVDGLTVEFQVPLLPAVAFYVAIVGCIALVPAAAVSLWAGLSSRLSAVAAPLVFAALWVLGEWVRTALLGAPWLLLAHTLTEMPLWLQTASLAGAWAPGFVVAVSGAGLGVAARRGEPRALGVPLLLVLSAGAYGAASLAAGDPAGEGFRVAVVQASVPQDERFLPGSALRNTVEHATMTRRIVAEAAPDLVVWSETAVDQDLDANPALGELLEELVRETGVPLVTGAPRRIEGRPVNVVVLITPDAGLVESYEKQRLVPIAEGEPAWMAWVAPLVPEVAEGQPYVPGDESTVFRAATAPFSTPICFEVTYPGLMRDFRSAGAEWIVNLSNDVWFGPVGYLEMHLDHAVLRAVELRTWLVRGANTGISAAIDPRGRVVGRIPAFEDGTLVVEVVPGGPAGLYARFGDAPAVAALVLLASGLTAHSRLRS